MMTLCGWLSLTNFCGDVADFFTSPLWYWGWWWFVVTAGAWALGWFFQSLRPICGVVVLVCTAALVAFWYGMKQGKARERARHVERKPQQQQQTDFFNFDWMWSR